MNKEIFCFLKNYGTDTYSINKLLVSSYIKIKNIKVIHNKLIKNHLIQPTELDYPELEKFINLIKNVDKEYSFEELLELFEFVISPSDKLINGAIYTPKNIREYITKECFTNYRQKIDNVKVVDIACGCGGFLIDAVNILLEETNKSYKQVFKDNIFGIDIQEYSIERTELLLILLAIENGEDEEEFEFNLHCGNSLEFNWFEESDSIKKNGGFDIILGNPPYVCSRNMDESTKSLMNNWSTCRTGHPDLYIPFFQIGYELLSKNGILGYITVNTFIKSVNGRAIREYFKKNKVDLRIIDFEDEQVFVSRMTYTSICFLYNRKSDSLYYKSLKSNQLNEKKIKFENHKYDEIDNPSGWYINNRKFVKKIENIGIAFGNIYNTKSGIATLKNKVYIFTPIKEDDEYFYIREDTKIEKNICRDIVNSNLLVKTNKIDNLIEKIIFPYLYDENDQVYTIVEDTLKKNYPYAYKYLLDNRSELETRDKGKGKDYKYWYAFGRNQSLERTNYKLLFPQLAKEGFKSCISTNKDLYFYNGMAVMSNNLEELKILEKIFMTSIFWKYVTSISKNYASNYFSLGRNYIKNFGIYSFSNKEKQTLIEEHDILKINEFVEKKYK